MKTLGVIGLGYVGLPLAVQATEKDYTVIGIDLNSELNDLVNSRKSPYVNDERFAKALRQVPQDKLFASNNFDLVSSADVIVICVPTPTENNIPDFSFVKKATKEVAGRIKKGQLIVLESTVNPGVTRDIVLPLLENISGLSVGKDFCLAHCPERIDPGNDNFFVGNLNRVVGGVTPECTVAAAEFYSAIIDAQILPLGSTEEAEFVKSWENSHRNVMIALANSAAIICDALDMDIDRILQGLQTKVDQFGLRLAQPGIGPGGHCIPEDIHYVIRKARQNGVDTRFLDDAAELNDKMPRYAVHQLADLVSQKDERIKDLKVALLGIAYKPDVADLRRSPSIEVGHQLVRYAKSVKIHDPYIKNLSSVIRGAEVAESLEQALEDVDVIFVGTAHSEYKKMLTSDLLNKSGVRYIFDGRNALDKSAIVAKGICYKGIGK